MTILTRGNPIPQKTPPTNTYKLHISFMHGDADADTSEWIYSKDAKLIGDMVEILSKWSAAPWNHRCNTTVHSTDHYATYATEDQGQALDNLTDLIPGDVSYGDGYAWPQKWTVTEFDENGVEYEVSITINGKTPSMYYQ